MQALPLAIGPYGVHGGRFGRAPVRVVAAIIGLLGLSACGSVHLYNEQNDAKAQAAKTGYDALKITANIETERANLDRQLTEEIAATNAFTAALADYHVAALLDRDPSPGSQGAVRIEQWIGATGPDLYLPKRLHVLGFSADNKASSLVDSSIHGLARSARAVEVGAASTTDMRIRLRTDAIMDSVADTTFQRPSCKDIVGKPDLKVYASEIPSSDSADEVLMKLQVLKGDCLTQPTSIEPSVLIGDGRIREAYQELVAARLAFNEAMKPVNDLKEKIDAKKTEIAKLSKNTALTPEEVAKEIKENAEEFAGHIDSVRQAIEGVRDVLKDAAASDEASQKAADNISRFGAILANEKIAGITCILNAVSTGGPAPEGGFCPDIKDEDGTPKISVETAARLAASIPSLAENLAKIQALDLTPSEVVRLRAELQRLNIEKAYHERQNRLAEQRVALTLDKYVAYLEEASQLRDVYIGVQSYTEQGGREQDAVACALDAALCAAPAPRRENQARESIGRAVLAYASSISDARARQYSADHALTQINHLRALNADELALADWNLLIEPALTELAAYHASGIKKQTLTNIVQGLANLGVLGVLVSKE